MNKIQTFKLN